MAIGLISDLAVGAESGGSQAWNATRASLVLQLATPVTAFTLKGAGGRFGGDSGESFHLGGVTSSLVPISLDLNRLEQPALPAYSAEGERFLQYRVMAGERFRAYLEGNVLWNRSEARGAFQRVLGLEYALELDDSGRNQVARKLSLKVGLHRPLDGAMEGRTVATLSLVLRP